jgi:hypothetical protein
MKTFIFLLFILTQSVFAKSSTRPKTPYWDLVGEVERAGFVAYAKYDWSDRSLQKLLRDVPVINNLVSQIGRKNVVYKMGGENPGKSGFTTVLKNGDIYVQVYYAKHLKVIDVVLTLGHELVHATHIDSGLHDMWRGLVRQEQKKYAECMSEMGAYTWSGIYASNNQTREWVAGQIKENQDCTQRIQNYLE